jgi:hypothetical protein
MIEGQGNTVFAGTAWDPEDGRPSQEALVWSSSRDGALGTGYSANTQILSRGVHIITLTATDSDGATGSASVTVTVQ